MLFRPMFLMSLTMIMAVILPLQTLALDKEPVKPLQQWSGSVDDLSLRQAAPEVILTKSGLKNLWQVWKVPGPVPPVNFSRNLVVVQTTRGSRLRLAATLDGHGNLQVLGLATRDLRPGFRYVIAVLSQKGVKTINGKKLMGEAGKPVAKSTARDRKDFGVSGIEVQSVKTLNPKQLNASVRKAAGKGEPWTKKAVLVALKFIGAGQKERTKVIDVRTSPENPDTAVITVATSGYLDDAISGERWRLWLEKNAHGTWTIHRALWAQLCSRPGHKFYSAVNCP
jgi:predicted small integral membrane protein